MANPYRSPGTSGKSSAEPRFALWNISRLKENLARGQVTERHVLIYVLLVCLWITGLGFQFEKEIGFWTQVDGVLFTLFTLLGTLYLYRKNGGSRGDDFLLRLVALHAVFGLRFRILVLVPTVFLGLSGYYFLFGHMDFPGPEEAEGGYLSLLTLIFELLYYWRMRVHFRGIRKLARKSKPG